MFLTRTTTTILPFHWILPNSIELYWVLLGFYWVLLGFTGFYWVLLGFTGFCWVSLGSTGFYWVLPGFAVLLLDWKGEGWPSRPSALMRVRSDKRRWYLPVWRSNLEEITSDLASTMPPRRREKKKEKEEGEEEDEEDGTAPNKNGRHFESETRGKSLKYLPLWRYVVVFVLSVFFLCWPTEPPWQKHDLILQR